MSQAGLPNQSSAIPSPQGYDENGVPFWMVNGRRVLWAELQQILWQQRQPVQPSSGKGPEAIPNLPAIPNYDSAQESKSEKAVEQGEKAPEKQDDVIIFQPQSTAVSTATTGSSSGAKKKPLHIGDTPSLKTVDLASEDSMAAFVEKNQRSSKTDSNFGLSVLLKKLLQAVSAA